MDTDGSDSEFGHSPEMDDTSLPPADDAVEEGANTRVLRSCAVVLDRLTPDEESGRKELEEREEMSRKGGKQLVSRIPTFQSSLGKKRSPAGGPNADGPLSRKDPPAELQEKALFADVPKSKLPSVREPTTTDQSPPPPAAVTEPPMAPPVDANGDGTRNPELYSFSTLTPRAGLRANAQALTISPEPSQDPEDDRPLTLTPPPGDSDEEAAPLCRTTLRASGDGDTQGYQEEAILAKERLDAARAIDIADEVPPWESYLLKYDPALDDPEVAETADRAPVRDAQPVQDDVTAKLPSGSAAGESGVETRSGPQHPVVQVEGLRKRPAPVSKSYRSELPRATRPPPAASHRAAVDQPGSPSANSSGCCRFALFFLLPLTLLLVGGLGQHAWHYGLPRSVDHLLAQLELRRLEGLGLTTEPCSTDCRVRLVESIPVGLYPSAAAPLPSISDSWLRLLGRANTSLEMAGFYMTLRDNRTPGPPDPTDAQGRKVFDELRRLSARGVQLQVAISPPQDPTQDTQDLADLAAAGAEVREVDLQKVSGGILHTKLWVVDHKHLYVGSANMDWRSLSQVKEVGLSVEDCGCLAEDASRIFGVYWGLGAEKNDSLPPYWPARLTALSSAEQPLHLRFNGMPARVYLSSAPPVISARGRTDDLWAILSVISDARQFIHISVMEYLPFSEFTLPARFWPAIDSELREAACARGVEVRLLVSCWSHLPPAMFVFLQSLQVLQRPPLGCPINVKVFTVPSTPEQMKIPYARVNHAKYMVTDRVAYIGTSNWSENYFVHTAGVGLVVNQTSSPVGPGQATVQAELDQLFIRDWSSSYATALPEDETNVCPHLSD